MTWTRPAAAEPPEPAVEALAIRMLLSVADSDQFLFNKCLTEIMDNPHRMIAVLASFALTICDLYDRHTPEWQGTFGARLARILDFLEKTQKESSD